MKKLLITGGTGFIGSHTCVDLLNKGYDLVVLDSFINSSPKISENISEIVNLSKLKNNLELIKCDLKNEDQLADIFLKHSKSSMPIEGVIHFAGLKSVLDSINNPLLYWDSNVGGTINLLKQMDIFKCNTIVFSSSATIYGTNNSN